jgi:hypothetical protein
VPIEEEEEEKEEEEEEEEEGVNLNTLFCTTYSQFCQKYIANFRQ